ncbi:hypothetical protein H7D62_016175, partial [Brucella melitensis]|uniref:hypothetical protein n=1 Tax=Brucella melitensis TaxID=29459 RepID=UPI001AA048FA
LFLLGSGTVHGFALTVAIGIGTTLFTTLTFTRLLIAQWVRTAPKVDAVVEADIDEKRDHDCAGQHRNAERYELEAHEGNMSDGW